MTDGRKPGNSRLVYNKTTRAIDTVRTHECGPGGETLRWMIRGVPNDVLDAMAEDAYERIGLLSMEQVRCVMEQALEAAYRVGYGLQPIVLSEVTD